MTAEVPATPRPLTTTEAAIPIAALIVLVGLSFFLFGDAGAKGPNQVALVIAAMIGLWTGRRAGYTLDELRDAAIASVGTGISAIFILFAVGALTGAWAMSGTLMAMVYYGLQILSPNYFYMTTAIICGIVAFSIGSSWTVAATIGIGLVGIAVNMDLSPAVTAGAVISGAATSPPRFRTRPTSPRRSAARTSTSTCARCCGRPSRPSASRCSSSCSWARPATSTPARS